MVRFSARWLPAAAACLFLILLVKLPTASAIGCFVCHSVNGSEPDCEDRFNNTERFYQATCMAGRKGRMGVFPGTDCIKMKAELDDQYGNPYQMVIRLCVVDNGDINSETEIGRSHHCGLINQMEYDNKPVRGCLVSCATDGCNSVAGLRKTLWHTIGMLVSVFAYYVYFL